MELHNAVKLVNRIINNSSEAIVAVIDEKNYPHVSHRSLIHPTTLRELYFSSDRGGNLHRRIGRNGKTGLTFSHDRHNITLTGITEEVTDVNIKKNRWLDWFANHYPGGPEGEEFILFRFIPERVSLWVENESFYLSRKDLLAVRSYCGLYCSHCSFRESQNCPGCLESVGTPFWGSCAVGACAAGKKLAHCGECPESPCDSLKEYSYGEGEHCDNPKGSRLEVLNLWKG